MKIPESLPSISFWLLVAVEGCVIFGLVFYVLAGYAEKKVYSVSPILKETITLRDLEDMDHFYELTPGTHLSAQPDWLIEQAVYTTNADTLNERFDYTEKKKQNVFRIVTVGDSYTFGKNVSTPDNFSEQLEDMLNTEHACPTIDAYEVINLGVAGYDIAYTAKRYELRGVKYDPDLVILTLIENDFSQINEFTHERMPYYQAYFKTHRDELDLPTYSQDSKSFDDSSDPAVGLHSAFRTEADQAKEISSEDMCKYQSDQLNKIRQLVAGDLLLYTFAAPVDVKEYGKSVINAFLKQNVDSSIDWYDSPVALSGDESLPDFHPSVQGHNRIALDLFSYIIANNYIQCDSENTSQPVTGFTW